MSDIKDRRFEMRVSEDHVRSLDQASALTGLSRSEVLTALLETEMKSEAPFWWLDEYLEG